MKIIESLYSVVRENDREPWAAIVQPEIDNTFGTSGQKWWKDVEDKEEKKKSESQKKNKKYHGLLIRLVKMPSQTSPFALKLMIQNIKVHRIL